tara:strand:- start:16894 stop:18717 length:1824 start_codon:yes stop_codon:yes gene_type:complete
MFIPKILCALALLLILPACSNLNGNVHLLKKGDSNYFYGPWKDSHEIDGVIKKSGKGDTSRFEDSFMITFDQAFFKYLPDFGNSNEVIVIFTFTEEGKSQDSNEIVKILGPMRNVGDSSYSSMISKVAYGPKRLESDILTVRVQVIEFDAEESEDSSAFLDFMTDASTAFSLADPVTQGEIKVAKEIAKTILSFNQNDNVLDIEFDVLPFDENENYWHKNENNLTARSIPLKIGEYLIVQQEVCGFLKCYFQFTADNNLNPLAWISDIALTPFVALTRTFTDTAGHEALSPLSIYNSSSDNKTNGATLAYNAKNTMFEYQVLSRDPDSRKLVSIELDDDGNVEETKIKNFFTDKTWITFSIQQGRDPSLWAIRKQLSVAEEKVISMLNRNSIKEIVEKGSINEAIDSLLKVQLDAQDLIVKQSSAAFLDQTVWYTSEFEKYNVCITKPKDAIIEFLSFAGDSRVMVNEIKLSGKKAHNSITECLVIELESGFTLKESSYMLNINLLQKGEVTPSAKSIDFKLINKPVYTTSKVANNLIQLTGNNLHNIQNVEVEISNQIFSFKKDKLIVSSDRKLLTMAAPLGVNSTDTIDSIIFKMPGGLDDIRAK